MNKEPSKRKEVLSKMVTPAGDMEVTVVYVGVEKNQIRIDGRFGVWDSQLYFSLEDITKLIRLSLNWATVLFMCRLPFFYAGRWLSNKRES